MTKRLRIGYMPLTDAALLHVAKAKHFAEARGLDLDLVRESSWANIRDKLVLGHFDAAHMLAPAAIASSLGVGKMAAQLVAPTALGLNGNAITISNALFDSVRRAAQGDLDDPHVTAKAIATVAAGQREKGQAALTFGHVFPFSSHHYQLRLWLRAGGLDADEDVRLVVVPPPFMIEALRKGDVDGFCVGAPWNAAAAAAGVGLILHSGAVIVRNCPEKVLAFRADWALSNEADLRALADAIGDASLWAADAGNRSALVALLTDAAEPGVSAQTIAAILDDPTRQRGGAIAAMGLRLDPAAVIAHRSHALWLFAQMVAAGQVAYSPALAEAAANVYRPDLGPSILGPALPDPAEIPIAFEGQTFSPDDLPAYLAALAAPVRR